MCARSFEVRLYVEEGLLDCIGATFLMVSGMS